MQYLSVDDKIAAIRKYRSECVPGPPSSEKRSLLMTENQGKDGILVNNATVLNDIGLNPSDVCEETLRQNIGLNRTM